MTKFLPQAELCRQPKIKEVKRKNARFIETLFTKDRTPNSAGVTQAGFLQEISLEKFENKKIDFALILGHSFTEDWLLELLDNIPFVWHITCLKNPILVKAHLVMPSLTHLEKRGTFTNKNGLVQDNIPAIPCLGGKSEVDIFRELEKAEAITSVAV